MLIAYFLVSPDDYWALNLVFNLMAHKNGSGLIVATIQFAENQLLEQFELVDSQCARCAALSRQCENELRR